MVSGADQCPHPDAIAKHSVTVRGRWRSMTMCGSCYAMFDELIEQWHAHQVGPVDVVARMRANGYTRADGAQFLLQLTADRLRVRLGFASHG